MNKISFSNSFFSLLDPRVKLLLLLVLIASLFISSSYFLLSIILIIVIVLILSSKISPKKLLGGSLNIILLLLILNAVELIINRDNSKRVIMNSCRIIMIILFSNLIALTTKPQSLSKGIESILTPLKLFHINTHDIAQMINLVFRFIPLLREDGEKMNYLLSLREDNNTFKSKIKRVVRLLFPLFVSSYYHSESVALALDSKLYFTKEKSTLNPLKLSSLDIYTIVFSLVFLAIIILLRGLNVSLF